VWGNIACLQCTGSRLLLDLQGTCQLWGRYVKLLHAVWLVLQGEAYTSCWLDCAHLYCTVHDWWYKAVTGSGGMLASLLHSSRSLTRTLKQGSAC
jgi:hypothetical protein